MATYIVDAPIKEVYGENLTVAGSAGPRNVYLFRHGYKEILIEPQAAMRLSLAPRIAQLWFYDNSAATKWVNLIGGTNALINRHVAGDTGTTLDAMQTADYIYVGCKEQFLGLYVDMDATTVNAVVNALAAGYTKSDDTFATATISSDGTASGGATLAQDGLVVITVPTDWREKDLSAVLSDTTAPSQKLYWLRFSVSVAVSADVEAEQFSALMTPVSQGGYFKVNVEYTMDLGEDAGAIETIATAAGATSVNVTWIKR